MPCQTQNVSFHMKILAQDWQSTSKNCLTPYQGKKIMTEKNPDQPLNQPYMYYIGLRSGWKSVLELIQC